MSANDKAAATYHPITPANPDQRGTSYNYNCLGCGHPMHDNICQAPVIYADGTYPCGHI